MNIEKKKTLIVLFFCASLSACDSAPRQPEIAKTPLEGCIYEARHDRGICGLIALGKHPRESQICDDRMMMQEDRCYARFKK
jgi:hypothetical protein